MNVTDEKLDQLLRDQKWIEPASDFTANVMHQVSMERALQPAPVVRTGRTRGWERALMMIPALIVLTLILQFAPHVGDYAMSRLRELGFWLGSTTKFPLFAAYPILILAIIAPVFAGAVSACALSSRCRIARVLTS